jgi:hypothetical protein
MTSVVNIAFIAVAAALVIGTIAYWVNAGRLLRRLMERHKSVHESLGSPLLIMNNTPRNNVLFFRWIWSSDFEALEDSGSVKLANLVRSLLVWLLVGFAVLVVLFVAFSVTL